MISHLSTALAAGEVHVWWFGLDLDPEPLAELTAILASDERERAARFYFQRDRRRATAARGLLRSLLGRYLGCDPREVQFEYGPQGKPFLLSQRVHFNLAHSGELGVCALTLDRPIGVDVELVRADFDHRGVAEYSFSVAERAELSTLPASAATRGFFRCWTLKEAYIKARGGGLSIPLDTFDVPLTVSRGAQAVVSREPVPEAQGWFVRELAFRPDAAAAVAMRSASFAVRELVLPTL